MPEGALRASARWTAGGRLAIDYRTDVAGPMDLYNYDVAARNRQNDGREVTGTGH